MNIAELDELEGPDDEPPESLTDTEADDDYSPPLLSYEDFEDLDAETSIVITLTPKERQEACLMLTKVRALYLCNLYINMLEQARSLAIYVQNSPLRRDQLRAACLAANLPDLALIQPIKIRWNSSGECIIRTLELRPAIHNITGAGPMEKFQLTREEWKIAEQLDEPMMVSFYASSSLSRCSSSPVNA